MKFYWKLEISPVFNTGWKFKDMIKLKEHKKESQLEELKKQCQEYLNGWKRAKADYENLQKQVAKEKEAFIRFANMNLLMGLIPVYNNLKLACTHLPKDEWVKGIEQVKKQFEEVLKYNGVEEIIPKKGDKFDPEIYEAVEHTDKTRISTDDPDVRKVSEVVSEGYKLNGKVFVPARVIVK